MSNGVGGFPVPAVPAVPADQIATATWEPRYEDVAQDGRLLVLGLPPALGMTTWRPLLTRRDAMRAATKQGIVPILTRLVVGATAQTVRIDRPLRGTGRYALARSEKAGEVERLYLNIWVDVDGTTGRMVPPIPAGDFAPAGSVFAEHVFTRLFAPPDQRKLVRFELDGVPPVPELLYEPPAPATAAELPAGATWLDDARVVDPVATVLGLDHTDSNQHVNSLVYIRILTEAALRRLDHHGKRGALLVRGVELAYRKPCFAGDKVRIALRAFVTAGGGLGAAGVLIADGDPADRPRAYARLLIE
jgi:hypothetical protein